MKIIFPKISVPVITYVFNIVFPVVTFVLCIGEAIIYSGYVNSLIHIDIFTTIIITSAMIFLFGDRKEESWKFISKANEYLILPSVVIITATLLLVEVKHYIGYVFQYIHIIPENLIYFIFFAIILLFLDKLPPIKEKLLKNNKIMLAAYALIFWATAKMVYYGSWYLLGSINQLVSNKNYSIEAQYKSVWGSFYDLTKLVEHVVPAGSSILQPSQINPWQMEGNQLLTRYFIYPRRLEQIKTEQDYYQELSKSNYVLVTKGNTRLYPTPGFARWPIQPTPFTEFTSLTPLKNDINISELKVSSDSKNWKNIRLDTTQITLSDNSPRSETVRIIKLTPDVQYLQLSYSSSSSIGHNLEISWKNSVGKNDSIVFSPTDTLVQQKNGEYLTTINTSSQEISSKVMSQEGKYDLYLGIKVTTQRPLLFLYDYGVAKVEHKVSTDEADSSVLGDYYFSLGDMDKAKQNYLASLLVSPDDIHALYSLYCLSLKTNQINANPSLEQKLIHGLSQYLNQEDIRQLIITLKEIYAPNSR